MKTAEVQRSNSPLFIFGAPRSGTSLLTRMIDAHPAIAIPYESHIYNTFYKYRGFYGDLRVENNRRHLIRDVLRTDTMRHWVPRVDLDRAMSAVTRYDFHGIVEGILRSWVASRQDETTIWGEKTPAHIFYWREILDGFPSAKILHIVRDGRDVAMSLKKARFGPKHYYFLAEYWADYLAEVENLKSHLTDDRFLQVRYEDLLVNSESVLKSVCEFIGIGFRESMIRFHESSNHYPTDDRNMRNLSRPVLVQNAGKWRKSMQQSDVQLIESVAGNKLIDYGYDLSGPPIAWPAARIRLYKVIHPFLRFWAMAKNTRGYNENIRMAVIYSGMFFRQAIGRKSADS